MATKTMLRQRDRRYTILRPDKAVVEFSHGRRGWRLPLVDLSVAGLSFTVEEEVPGLEEGLKLENVVVRITECEMHGDLVIRRATAQPDWSTQYGVIFYPAEEADMLKLNGVLAGIEAIHTR
jgi:hypothetical protein